MVSSEQYKCRTINNLARGETKSLEQLEPSSVQDYQNFDSFAKRSWQEERHQGFEKSLHPKYIPLSRMEPELQKAIAQIKPNERHNIAREFVERLKARGVSDRNLEKHLSLSTPRVSHMNADDVTKLAAFTYHTHPDIFQDALVEQPAIVKFLSAPLVGAILRIIAAKWLGNRRY